LRARGLLCSDTVFPASQTESILLLWQTRLQSIALRPCSKDGGTGGWEEEGEAVSEGMSGFRIAPINEEEEVRFLVFISVPRY